MAKPMGFARNKGICRKLLPRSDNSEEAQKACVCSGATSFWGANSPL